MKKNNNDELDLELVPFITDIPVETVELEIHVTIYHKGKMENACMKLDMTGIREGMIQGDEWLAENGEWKLANVYEENEEAGKRAGN